MSTFNGINTSHQTGAELLQDKAESSSRNMQETDKAEKITLTEKIKLAEDVKKADKNEGRDTPAMTPKQLEKVAQQLQDFMGEMNRSLEFLVDKDSGRDVIKVLDKGTGDLVKQYPSEEVLTLISKLSDATGNLIDTEI
jgi:flagellar protein FlaG